MTIKDIYSIYSQNGYSVSTDSRKIRKGDIFFALKGENFDGNAFALDALEKGAVLAVIDNPDYHIPGKTLFTNDSLKTLQELATYHRKQLDIPVIGLTGTAGKTTTKELIRQVLNKKYKTYATQGNLNNHIGVPLTILSITPDYQMAVVEMGASHPGEIARLCEIARPTHGLITNIGTAHIEGFGTRENLIHTKTALYRYLEKHNGTIFLNIDDSLLTTLTKHKQIHTYGTSDSADTHGKITGQNPFVSLEFTGKDKQTYTVNTKLFGTYNLYNILAAIAIGQYFNIPDKDIAAAIEEYEPRNNRSQIKKTRNNTLILDLYNANPTSMSKALESFARLKADNKVLILGDMLELGEIEDEEHRKILSMAEDLGFSKIYLVGEIFGRVNSKYPHFATSEEMAQWLQSNPLKNKFILLKASRGIHLEKLTELL